jgi:hypothetical protein
MKTCVMCIHHDQLAVDNTWALHLLIDIAAGTVKMQWMQTRNMKFRKKHSDQVKEQDQGCECHFNS